MRSIGIKNLPNFLKVWAGRNRPNKKYTFESANKMCLYLSFLPCGFYVNVGVYGASYCVVKFNKVHFDNENKLILFSNSQIKAWEHSHAIGQELTLQEKDIADMFISQEGMCVICLKNGNVLRITSAIPGNSTVFSKIVDMSDHVEEFLRCF